MKPKIVDAGIPAPNSPGMAASLAELNTIVQKYGSKVNNPLQDYKPPVPDGTVFLMGFALAEWADYGHVMVKINHQAVTNLDMAAAGYDHVFWSHFDANGAPSGYENVQKNLAGLVSNSPCDKKAIAQYLNGLDVLVRLVEQNDPSIPVADLKKSLDAFTSARVASDLSCLGKIEFEKLVFSSD